MLEPFVKILPRQTFAQHGINSNFNLTIWQITFELSNLYSLSPLQT